METIIRQAIDYLREANYAGYFEEMDKVIVPDHLKTPYIANKNKFISGKYEWIFYQELEVFSKLLLPQDAKEIAPIHPPERKHECGKLTEWLISADKPIFSIYGVAQMGKTETIRRWAIAEKKAALANYQTITIHLEWTEQSVEKACETLKIKDLANSQDYVSPFKEKTLVIIENFEVVLGIEDKGEGIEIRKEGKPFEYFLEAVLRLPNIKVLIESRYKIAFSSKIWTKQTSLGKELGELGKGFFLNLYQNEPAYDNWNKVVMQNPNLVIEIFERLYTLSSGNTWLMLNVPRTFRKVYLSDPKILKTKLDESQFFHEYREVHLDRLLDSLPDFEFYLLVCFAEVFEYLDEQSFENLIYYEDKRIRLEQEETENALTSLQDWLLIAQKQENNQIFTINPYLREVCRRYIALKKPQILQEAEELKQRALGKNNRQSPDFDIVKFSQGLENAEYPKYRTELAIAYQRKSKETQDDQEQAKYTQQAIELMQESIELYADDNFQKLYYYNKLLDLIDNFETAKSIFEEMRKAGIKGNEISYSTLINKATDFPKAFEVFEEMRKAGIKGNEISYNTLINKATDFPKAKSLYADFLQIFPFQKGNFRREKNYNFLFTTLFKKVKRKEDWDFVRSEIKRLGLQMDKYMQDFL